MRPLPLGDKWLTPQQAAIRLRIGVRTLSAHAKAGHIESELSDTGRRMYRLGAVNAVLDQRERER